MDCERPLAEHRVDDLLCSTRHNALCTSTTHTCTHTRQSLSLSFIMAKEDVISQRVWNQLVLASVYGILRKRDMNASTRKRQLGHGVFAAAEYNEELRHGFQLQQTGVQPRDDLVQHIRATFIPPNSMVSDCFETALRSMCITPITNDIIATQKYCCLSGLPNPSFFHMYGNNKATGERVGHDSKNGTDVVWPIHPEWLNFARACIVVGSMEDAMVQDIETFIGDDLCMLDSNDAKLLLESNVMLASRKAFNCACSVLKQAFCS